MGRERFKIRLATCICQEEKPQNGGGGKQKTKTARPAAGKVPKIENFKKGRGVVLRDEIAGDLSKRKRGNSFVAEGPPSTYWNTTS